MSAAVVLAGGLGLANAATHTDGSVTTQATHTVDGKGMNGFGKTAGSFRGHADPFTYTHGYFCDLSVASKARTGCEVGAKWNKAPSKQHDPLYITVPLGFTAGMKMQCPDKLTCIDHPRSMDLTRLATTLAPIFGTTADQLRPALRNYRTPGHDHFIADRNMGKKEWWDVRVIGVTKKATYDRIQAHDSFGYIKKLQANGNKNVTSAIPTNLFLFFAAK